MQKKINLWLHIPAWIGFLVLPIFIIPKPLIKPEDTAVADMIGFTLLFICNLLLISYYYINYYVLVPKFVLKRKYFIYIVFCILAAIVIFFVPLMLVPKPDTEYIPIPEKNMIMVRLMQNLFMYLAILFASTSSRLIHEWNVSEEKRKAAENERLKAEIKAIKFQINPHFLFNTLNTLYALSIKKNIMTSDAILKLSSLMRYVISESHQEYVLLKQEIQYIEDYISLERMRIPDNVKINYSLLGDCNHYLITPLVLIAFIENTFKHGVSNENECNIHIKILIQDGKLLLHTSNIIYKNITPHSTGIGLQTALKRLSLSYENKHTYSQYERNGIYIMDLEITLK
ncbi:MAG: histidine kinase [Cytophagales bacterium]|nr:histidine kinase [Cytophagales bacterium]